MRTGIPWRSLWTTVHRWFGLATALFLIVAGLTGAITSWDHEIDEWLNEDLFHVPSRGPIQDPLELVKRVEAADPRTAVIYVSFGVGEGETAKYFVRPLKDPATGKPYRLGYNQVFVDPVTGGIVGRRDSRAVSLSREHLMPFLRKLHFRLVIPPFGGTDRWGYWLMGAVALVWLVDSFIGFYLTLPPRSSRLPHAGGDWRARLKRWKPAWKIRRSAGSYKLNFDLHRAFGLWTFPIILVIAFTSFSLNLYNEIFYPVMSLVSKVTPSVASRRPPAPLGTVVIPKYDFAAVRRIATDEAAKRGWTTPMGGMFYNARYGFYNVSFFDRELEGGNGSMVLSNLYIDGADGRLLGENVPWKGTAADVFLQLQFPLHSGRILGLPGRIMMSAMGVIIAMLSVTGIVIWARKRRARLLQARGHTASGRQVPAAS